MYKHDLELEEEGKRLDEELKALEGQLHLKQLHLEQQALEKASQKQTMQAKLARVQAKIQEYDDKPIGHRAPFLSLVSVLYTKYKTKKAVQFPI